MYAFFATKIIKIKSSSNNVGINGLPYINENELALQF
jgi:hypothetical protein